MAPTVLFLLALWQSPNALTPDPTRPRVRPMDADATRLVRQATSTSPTVARLVADLDRYDVVVYVRATSGSSARGVLTYVAYGEPLTYVMARIDLRQGSSDRLLALAHELTHALEIAEACTPVRSEAELDGLYRAIGRSIGNKGEYESERALATEAEVRREFAHARATPPPAAGPARAALAPGP